MSSKGVVLFRSSARNRPSCQSRTAQVVLLGRDWCLKCNRLMCVSSLPTFVLPGGLAPRFPFQGTGLKPAFSIPRAARKPSTHGALVLNAWTQTEWGGPKFDMVGSIGAFRKIQFHSPAYSSVGGLVMMCADTSHYRGDRKTAMTSRGDGCTSRGKLGML